MASSRHRETMSTYMQRSILLRVKSYDLGTDCLIHGKPSWMMQHSQSSTRALFDLGWRRGYTQEDQALPLRGSLPLVPRAASPPGRNPGACTVKKSLRRSVSTISICGTMLRSRRNYQYATVEMLGFYIIIRYLENIIKN